MSSVFMHAWQADSIAAQFDFNSLKPGRNQAPCCHYHALHLLPVKFTVNIMPWIQTNLHIQMKHTMYLFHIPYKYPVLFTVDMSLVLA